MKPISVAGSIFKSSALFLFSMLLITGGCKVHFIPDYSAALSQDIVNTAKKVDNFYLTMQEVPAAKRQYDSFSEKYVDIETDLNSLLNRNRVRPLNKELTRITEIALQLWGKYKTEHKTDNALSDGLITLNRKTFNDLFYTMQVAEEAKNFKSVPNP